MKKEHSGIVIAARIIAGGVVTAALLGGFFTSPSKDVTFEIDVGDVQVVQSIEELNAIITDRWRRIDEFLGVLLMSSTFDAIERNQIAVLRARLRAKHHLHSAALQEGNLVLAHKRLRDLQSDLTDIKTHISGLRPKHPDILASLSGEFLEFWHGGKDGMLMWEISYQTKNQGILDKLKQWFL